MNNKTQLIDKIRNENPILWEEAFKREQSEEWTAAKVLLGNLVASLSILFENDKTMLQAVVLGLMNDTYHSLTINEKIVFRDMIRKKLEM